MKIAPVVAGTKTFGRFKSGSTAVNKNQWSRNLPFGYNKLKSYFYRQNPVLSDSENPEAMSARIALIDFCMSHLESTHLTPLAGILTRVLKSAATT